MGTVEAGATWLAGARQWAEGMPPDLQSASLDLLNCADAGPEVQRAIDTDARRQHQRESRQ